MTSDDQSPDWLGVIARSFAYLCLKQAQIEHKPMLEKANFLQGIGLNRADAAAILGTTSASLAELQRQANKKSKRGGSRGKGKSSR